MGPAKVRALVTPPRCNENSGGIMGELRFVRFETLDGLRLNGMLADARSDITTIHIHGRGGNFYENSFLRKMYEEYPRRGINLLSFNNRGHSSYVEAHLNGNVAYIGSAIEQFEDCLLDLEAACTFARSFSSGIVLQGHSLGCEKVMYYGLHSDDALPLILLSPSDGYRLQTVYRYPESVEEQVSRLRSTYQLGGLEFLPEEEYGIRNRDLYYHVPITARALVSLLTGPAFRVLRRGYPLGEPLQNKCFVYLGGLDALQVDGAEAMVEVLRERFVNPDVELYPQGDHHLRGAMPDVLNSLSQWILRTVRTSDG